MSSTTEKRTIESIYRAELRRAIIDSNGAEELWFSEQSLLGRLILNSEQIIAGASNRAHLDRASDYSTGVANYKIKVKRVHLERFLDDIFPRPGLKTKGAR